MFLQVPLPVACVGVALVLGVVTARPSLPQDLPQVSPSYAQGGSPYSFQYGVKDEDVGAAYGHDANSDGRLIKGTYYVALPDGRQQIVKYYADPVIGYVADVEFEGIAEHPILQYGGPPS